MKDIKVSEFMLERFRLGELNPAGNLTIREALVRDGSLRASLEDLDESDRELRSLYPLQSLKLPEPLYLRRKRIANYARIAAAVLICVLLPALFFSLNKPGDSALKSNLLDQETQDRAKGSSIMDVELSLFIQGGPEIPLPDKTPLSEGNTVQLAYSIPAGEHYGVIFSIDGRFFVTLHYPYRKGQSPVLVSGRRSFLSEAYTLDDAPDFEVFIMVVSTEPLDTEAVLREAENLAGKAAVNTGSPAQKIIEEEIGAAFMDYDVEALWVLKK